MRTVNMHEAKTHLSRLMEAVEKGESIYIAKSGKPRGLLSPASAAKQNPERRLGFLKGKITVPDDIKTPFRAEIEEMFYGSK